MNDMDTKKLEATSWWVIGLILILSLVQILHSWNIQSFETRFELLQFRLDIETCRVDIIRGDDSCLAILKANPLWAKWQDAALPRQDSNR